MTTARVSCIVPVFNGERFLGEAIDSIIAQTHAPFEVIVVDDGSTDGTKALVEGYGSAVRYLWQSNAGPATARNTGIAAATGEFVSFLDADDVWHPGKSARQLALFDARPALQLCVTHIQNVCMPEAADHPELSNDGRRARSIVGYSTVTLLARRHVFTVIGDFDTALKHGDDTDWFIRATEHGYSIEVVPEVLVHRRLHAGNRSRQWASRSRTEYLRLMKRFVDAQRAKAARISVET
jgi:glycosyltransferase involved in cell wall biosynthesis